MKHLLLTTIAAVVLVGCGKTQQSAPEPEAKPIEPVAEAVKPEPPKAKAPRMSIISAAMGGYIEAVKQHLAAGTDVNAKDDIGLTPLHMAARSHKEIVELLIANGADVNAKNKWGQTPLHYAANRGNKETAALLIAAGADVKAKSPFGGTPLDTAVDFRNTEVADLLRKHGGKTGAELENAEPVAEAAQPEPPTAKAPDISIHDAARDGNIETVKQHIAAGTDVNAKSEWGMSPLHYAVVNGRKEIAELLIAAGADVNLISDFRFGGETPLDKAIKYKQTDIADLIRKHGGKTGAELKAEGK
jgi:ankyrin repeat protein